MLSIRWIAFLQVGQASVWPVCEQRWCQLHSHVIDVTKIACPINSNELWNSHEVHLCSKTQCARAHSASMIAMHAFCLQKVHFGRLFSPTDLVLFFFTFSGIHYFNVSCCCAVSMRCKQVARSKRNDQSLFDVDFVFQFERINLPRKLDPSSVQWLEEIDETIGLIQNNHWNRYISIFNESMLIARREKQKQTFSAAVDTMHA